MLGNDVFNFHTIKTVTETFGWIFQDITIQRINPNTYSVQSIKVPLSQSAKEKWAVRMEEDPNAGDEANQRHVQIVLPRLGYELTGLRFDSKRKLPTTNYRVAKSGNGPTALTQLNPVPYIFDFELYLQTRTISDSYAIIEQFLAFFGPDYTVPIIDIQPEMNLHRDIIFTLMGGSRSDTFEGNFQTKRVIEWQFNFQAQAFIYPPIKEKPVINDATVNLHELDETYVEADVNVVANPGNIDIDKPYDIVVTETENN